MSSFTSQEPAGPAKRMVTFFSLLPSLVATTVSRSYTLMMWSVLIAIVSST
jgi:hypothetical protein